MAKSNLPKPAPVNLGSKQQQMFAFVGLVLFLTGLVATALLGQFSIITGALCILGVLVGSVSFLPKLSRNLNVYANMFLYSIFFCAAAIVFFIILQKHPLTYDATQSRNYSLSPVTSNFLKRLDQPIRATAFIANKQERTAASLLLGEYSRYTPQFEYRIVDPFRETGTARLFGSDILPGDVFLERMTTGTATADRVVKVSKLTEEQLTNGIMQILRGRDLTLYFTTGHGEPPLKEDKVAAAFSSKGPDPDNLEGLVNQLESSYIKAVPLDLSRRNSIPSDASAVVVVRPRIDFDTGETRALRQYMENGGRVMFLLSPDMPQIGNEVRTALTNLSALIKLYGIELPPDAVILPYAKQQNQSVYVTPALPQEHRITQGATLKEPLMMFEQSRPVIPGTPPQNTFLETFLVSPDDAWPFPIEELQRVLLTRTEPRIAPKDEELKSIPLGVASTHLVPAKGEEGATKVMVVGNGNFVTSRYLTTYGWLTFMNGVNWLTDSGDLIAIPSSQIENTPAILTAGQRQFLFILVVIAVPTLIALGGLGYSVMRRGTLH